MPIRSISAIIIIIISNTISIIAQENNYDVNEFKSHLKFLSDDLLQGRLPGTPGGDLAALYIASQFERWGLEPISKENGYFQNFSILSVSADYNSVNFKIIGNNIQENIKPYEEIMVLSPEKKESIELEGELIFVGYGIEAPEFGWDDYKGIDVNGKILVFLSGHPDFGTPNYKQGNTTYYGHWDYKPKIAFDKGAKGILIIHENPTLFSWEIWQEYLSHAYFIESSIKTKLPISAHVAETAIDRVLQHVSLSTKDLIEKANNKDFSPFPLQLNLKTKFNQSVHNFISPNVIGTVQGLENPSEAIIFMAHYDHLGISTAYNGDSIYNGAIDNASGTAGLLTLAKYFSKNPAKRSIIFLATTAEEMGQLGAENYIKNPIIPIEKTIIGLNMDMLNFLGIKDSIELSPVVFTDAIKTIREISSKMDLGLILSDYDNEFHNFRSDNYPFALYDIVTLNIGNTHIRGNYLSIPESKKKDIIEAGGLNWHTPFDEIKPWFRYEGIFQELDILKEVGTYYANDGEKPTFHKNNPFEPAKLLWSK